MKTLFFFVAFSLPLIYVGCADNGQEISPLSPVSSAEAIELEKADSDISHPFKLYESLPQLTAAKVSWTSSSKGLRINVNSPSAARQTFLFAVIEYIDVDNAMHSYQMVYLGNSVKGTYTIPSLRNRAVGSIKIYSNTSNMLDRREPYNDSQLFRNIPVHGWSDGSTVIKISAGSLPDGLRNLFAELTAVEGNMLVYLGKPADPEFDFPKSEKLTVTGVRLMGYSSKQVSVVEPNYAE